VRASRLRKLQAVDRIGFCGSQGLKADRKQGHHLKPNGTGEFSRLTRRYIRYLFMYIFCQMKATGPGISGLEHEAFARF
jgi:hypothetical protein